MILHRPAGICHSQPHALKCTSCHCDHCCLIANSPTDLCYCRVALKAARHASHVCFLTVGGSACIMTSAFAYLHPQIARAFSRASSKPTATLCVIRGLRCCTHRRNLHSRATLSITLRSSSNASVAFLRSFFRKPTRLCLYVPVKL